jgi:hypothetical protein
MSSHHFVKDQQEPAVFILNAEGIHFTQVSAMLEWVPTVLVIEEALEQVLSWGIKIDVILSSDSFQKANPHLLEEQYPVKFLTVSDGDFLNKGLQYLIDSDHKAVHLIGISHQKAFELEEKTALIDLTIIDGDWKYYPAKHGIFKKWFAESTIHIHAKEGLPVEIQNSNGQLILPINYATMIEVPEGTTEIKAPGLIWIGEMVR